MTNSCSNECSCKSDWKNDDYYKLLTESSELARECARILQLLYVMDSYCTDVNMVTEELETVICYLQELRRATEFLLKDFDPCCFYCPGLSYRALLRTHTTARYMLQLIRFLLTLDFCEDNQQLRFFIESLRKVTDEARVNSTNLQLALDNFKEGCK